MWARPRGGRRLSLGAARAAPPDLPTSCVVPCLVLHPRDGANAAVGQDIGFKEVIQPQVPLRLPCYDFVPVMNHTVVTVLPKVRLATSGATHFHDVTGGVYKARERIHRDILIRDY